MIRHNAWLICAKEREITPILIEGDGLASYYHHLHTNMVEVAGYLPNGDMAIVDEEGLLKISDLKETDWILLRGVNSQPLIHRVIVVGDNGDDWTDPKSTLADLKAIVEWLTPKEAAMHFSRQPGMPQDTEGVSYIDARYNPFDGVDLDG